MLGNCLDMGIGFCVRLAGQVPDPAQVVAVSTGIVVSVHDDSIICEIGRDRHEDVFDFILGFALRKAPAVAHENGATMSITEGEAQIEMMRKHLLGTTAHIHDRRQLNLEPVQRGIDQRFESHRGLSLAFEVVQFRHPFGCGRGCGERHAACSVATGQRITMAGEGPDAVDRRNGKRFRFLGSFRFLCHRAEIGHMVAAPGFRRDDRHRAPMPPCLRGSPVLVLAFRHDVSMPWDGPQGFFALFR